MKLGPLTAALVCFGLAGGFFAVALADVADFDPSAALDEMQARKVMNQAFAAVTPTPFPESFEAELSGDGNLRVGRREVIGIFVTGKGAPAEAVPPSCREDFKRSPAATTIVCLRLVSAPP